VRSASAAAAWPSAAARAHLEANDAKTRKTEKTSKEESACARCAELSSCCCIYLWACMIVQYKVER
jgi:hypothetical protein